MNGDVPREVNSKRYQRSRSPACGGEPAPDALQHEVVQR
jgi:hypothetical protein